MNKYFYLAFLPLHLFGLYAIFHIGSVSWILFAILWILIEGYGIQVCFHRLISHRGFSTNKLVRNFLSFVGCLGIQGSPLFWAAIHRGYHHKHSDTEKDIHSPIHGNLWSYFLWTIKVDVNKLSFRSVTDLIRDPFQMMLNNRYFYIIWIVWIAAFLISPWVFCTLILVQLSALHSDCIVNLFCHKKTLVSYRNFDTPDTSQNIHLLGLLFFGIGYHNNHHKFPNNNNFAQTKYEFDPGHWLVKSVSKK